MNCDGITMSASDKRHKVNILLVHGIAASSDTWNSTKRLLGESRGFSVYTPDLLGHKTSGVHGKREKITLEDQAAYLNTYINENIEGEVFIVAHSYGGLAVSVMQLLYPDIKRKIILVNSPILGGKIPLFVEYFRNQFLSSILDFLVPIEVRVRFSLSKLYAKPCRITQECVDFYTDLLGNPAWVQGVRLAALGLDLESLQKYSQRAGSIIGFVAFIRSMSDIITSRGILAELDALFPGIIIREIRDCGHNVQEECPETLVANIVSIVGEIR
jgi:pimeloyl-ACP methyl ester carboxylesterase